MSLTITISSCSAAKVTDRCCSGESWRPEKISAYMAATRSGVSWSPSRSGSSPIASRISRTAFSIRPVSISPMRVLGLAEPPHPARVGGGPRGPLRDLGQDLEHLGRVQGLLLHERLGQLVEGLAVADEDLPGLVVGL